MNERVVASEPAVKAAETMRLILGGGLGSDLRDLERHGQLLSAVEHWDGHLAERFRGDLWPRTLSTLERTLLELDHLQESVRRVNLDIIRAGTEPLPGGPAPAGVPGEGPPRTDPRDDPKVRDAVAYFHAHVGDSDFWHGDRKAVDEIDTMMQGLTPEQRAAFLAQLSDDDLRKWNEKLAGRSVVFGRAGMVPFGGVGHDRRLATGNLVVSSLDPSQIARYEHAMPWLQPDLRTIYQAHDYPGAKYESTAGVPLWGASGQPDALRDISQGDDGDCWFLAGLGSVAMANPQLLENNIHANPNGTYTVTFYRDGHPVQVTVTDDVPTANGVRIYENGAKWTMLYEKAYAELDGGYGRIGSGFGDTSIRDLTGHPTSQDPAPATSLADVDRRLKEGYAITTGTWPDEKFGRDDDRIDGTTLVSRHEYMVQSVDTTAHPPTITVVNPWGPNGSAPHVVTLTESDWHTYFRNVSFGRVRP